MQASLWYSYKIILISVRLVHLLWMLHTFWKSLSYIFPLDKASPNTLTILFLLPHLPCPVISDLHPRPNFQFLDIVSSFHGRPVHLHLHSLPGRSGKGGGHSGSSLNRYTVCSPVLMPSYFDSSFAFFKPEVLAPYGGTATIAAAPVPVTLVWSWLLYRMDFAHSPCGHLGFRLVL